MAVAATTLLSGGALIDLDGTLFVQLLLFFLTFFILRGFVFKPMLRLIDAREAATTGATAEAEALQKEAKEKEAAFLLEMGKVRQEASQERERLRKEGMRVEQELLASVRAETDGEVEKAQQALRESVGSVRSQLVQETPRLGEAIAERLLQGTSAAVAQASAPRVGAP